MNQILKFKITKSEIEGILAVELGVKKINFDVASWEEIMDLCEARIAWHLRRSTLVDLLEEAMNDYYKRTPFFNLDKDKE